MRRTCLWLTAVLVAPGCYSYQLGRLDAVQDNQSVRVRISPEEAIRLEEVRQTADRLVLGAVVRNDDAALLIDTAVPGAEARPGRRALTQRVMIPRSEIREVELRRLDRLRTGALVGTVAAGVAYVALTQLGEGRLQDPPGGPGGTESVGLRRLLQFKLPVRF